MKIELLFIMLLMTLLPFEIYAQADNSKTPVPAGNVLSVCAEIMYGVCTISFFGTDKMYFDCPERIASILFIKTQIKEEKQ